jgi:NTE family protein
MRTRLNPFSEREQGELINWGYAVCDAAIRRHVLADAVPPLQWPIPAFALDR